MTAETLVAIAVTGALGAVLRGELAARAGDAATTVAWLNVAGAAALGAATALVRGDLLLVLGTGFLGSTTTFSTWVVQLRASAQPVRRALTTLALGVTAAGVGRLAAMLLS